MKYEKTSEEELYQMLREYGVNVNRIREMKMPLESLRDFVRGLDNLLERHRWP
jgi:hypothetical protein